MTKSTGALRRWTPEEDARLMDLSVRVPVLAAELGRSVRACEGRRNLLRRQGRLGYLPHLPAGSRLLVAKSCSRCHVLCDAALYRYRPHRQLYDSWCRYCHAAEVLARMGPHASRDRRQAETWANGAPERHYQPWLAADIEVLERTDLTVAQKARALGRTHLATAHAARVLNENAQRPPSTRGEGRWQRPHRGQCDPTSEG